VEPSSRCTARFGERGVAADGGSRSTAADSAKLVEVHRLQLPGVVRQGHDVCVVDHRDLVVEIIFNVDSYVDGRGYKVRLRASVGIENGRRYFAAGSCRLGWLGWWLGADLEGRRLWRRQRRRGVFVGDGRGHA
jgi:hypothetical protein